MRALLAVAMLVGCTDDVRLLGGHWGVTSAQGNYYMEGTMYVKPRVGGVVLEFIEVDVDPPRSDDRNGVYCSDFDTTIERLFRIELGDRAVALPGTVPVAPAFEPSSASAWVGLYDTGVAVTSKGTFNARACD